MIPLFLFAFATILSFARGQGPRIDPFAGSNCTCDTFCKNECSINATGVPKLLAGPRGLINATARALKHNGQQRALADRRIGACDYMGCGQTACAAGGHIKRQVPTVSLQRPCSGPATMTFYRMTPFGVMSLAEKGTVLRMCAFIPRHERLSGSMLQIRATRAATHRSFFRAKRPDTRVARHYPAPSTAAASVCT